jgi:two-component system, LuxR family, response regulator FixJ
MLTASLLQTGKGISTASTQVTARAAADLPLKPVSCQQLVHCIQDALALDRDLRIKASKQAAIEARLAQLTPREHEVLERVVEGVPNKCIAMELGITERTVEKHRESIMEKMGTRSLAKLMQMVLFSRRDGGKST